MTPELTSPDSVETIRSLSVILPLIAFAFASVFTYRKWSERKAKAKAVRDDSGEQLTPGDVDKVGKLASVKLNAENPGWATKFFFGDKLIAVEEQVDSQENEEAAPTVPEFVPPVLPEWLDADSIYGSKPE